MAHFIIIDVMIEEFHGNFASLKSYLCFMLLYVYEKFTKNELLRTWDMFVM